MYVKTARWQKRGLEFWMERREYAIPRTGRHFFDDMQLEAELIDRVRKV